MKGTVLTWEQLQEQDPRQTAIIVNYRKDDVPSWKRTRILLKCWMSREEAWAWCKANGIWMHAQERDAFIESFKLLRLNKVIRELAATKPANTSAVRVA